MRMNTQRILAALLSLVLLLALAPAGWADGEESGGGETGGTSEDPVVTQTCSADIVLGGTGMIDDLKTAEDAYVLAYKVANMVKSKTYDTYTFEATEAFAGANDGSIAEGVRNIQVRLDDSEIDKAKWDELAEGALDALQGNNNIINAGDVIADTNGVAHFDNLEPGLYLVIAYSKNLQGNGKHITSIDSSSTEVKEDANGKQYTVITQKERTVSLIQTKQYEYRYDAQLITVPTKDPYPDENGERNTANPTPWIFNPTFVLKPSRVERTGDLKIVKTLSGFYGSKPAMFVFEIEAELNGNSVYSDVVTLRFTADGTKTVTIADKIPCGATVTVTEVYSSSYTQTSFAYTYDGTEAAENGPVIEVDKVLTASFTNGPGDTPPGDGIVNHVDYQIDENGTENWVPSTPVDNADTAQTDKEA